MSVVVPPGMSEGMMMQVNTAQGMMQVQIPPGVKEGAEFQFQVGAVAPVQAATPVVAAVAAVPGTLVQMEGPQAVGAWKFYGWHPAVAGGRWLRLPERRGHLPVRLLLPVVRVMRCRRDAQDGPQRCFVH